MAAGKAVVATEVNQATSVIQNGYNGLLIEPGNKEMFAETLVTLLQDPAERLRLGRNAQQLAVKEHSWQQYTKQLEETYFSIL
jgi:glycosyltransferase involved in cell wall biosynthesis